jgi:hypothetical protein
MDRHLQRAHDALVEAVNGLTLDRLCAPLSGKWTIAEILEHLSRTYFYTTVGAQRTLAAGTPRARPLGLRKRLLQIVTIECGYLPTGVDAPKMVVPVGIDPATALSAATGNLQDMDAALNDAAARFGVNVKLMDHPIAGALSVRQWRKLHWVHTRHHVRQIRARISRLTPNA